ncbi:MAG TPA: SGNH/GDSL hydrolase family protein [Arachidicoccus sp.]
MKKYFHLSVGFLLSVLGLRAQSKDVDWANFAKYDSVNQIVKQLPQSERKVVFMGNSITEFWNVQDKDFFAQNKYINRGISGQTTSQMLVRFRKDVIDLQPKVVIILAGTNDIAGNTGYISLDNILGNLISMCEIAKANHIKPILCSLLPAFDYPWSRGKEPNIKIPQLNAMIKDYADKNKIRYVDYFSAMTDGMGGLPKNLSKDGVHPNLDGNKIMEKLSAPAIEQALK